MPRSSSRALPALCLRVVAVVAGAAVATLTACTSAPSTAGAPGGASTAASTATSGSVSVSPSAVPSTSPGVPTSSALGRTVATTTGTVLVIPGYGGNVDGLAPIVAALKKSGRRVRTVTLPNGAEDSFATQAKTLEKVVRAEEKAGHGPVDIVGHSNGGVLARYWVEHYKGVGRVRDVIALGSPQHGTTIAALAYDFGVCPAACAQVRPTSTFLAALNSGDETPAGVNWVTVWTTKDDVVLPATSAVLSGAVNVHLQTVCPADTANHAGLLGDAPVLGIVRDELRTAAPHAEHASDCARLTALGS